MTRQVTLMVNDKPVPADYFVQAFIDHTLSGMMEALEETGKLQTLSLSVDGDKVAIVINGAPVRANEFVSKIVSGTVKGMVSSLKGVSAVNKVNINMGR